MNEIKLQFHKENRNKKSIGNNIYKKAGGRGGKCRLPSDYLSNKEKRGLNGKVETVKLNEPMAYSDFKALSNTLKQEYLTNLVENHGARQSDVAEMFKMSRTVVNKLFKDIAPNVKFKRTGSKRADKKWLNFIGIEEEPTLVKMLTKTHDWSKHDNKEKPKINAVEEIRKEARELGIDKYSEEKTFISTGSITMTGKAAMIFNRIECLIDKDKGYEITINFRQI